MTSKDTPNVWAGLSDRERRFAEKQARRRDDAISDLRRVTDTTIALYVRRSRFTALPDGHKTRTLTDGLPHGDSGYTAVEAAADRLAFPGTEGVPDTCADPALLAIGGLFAALREAEDAADRAVQRLNELGRLATIREFKTGGPCSCCHRDVAGTEEDRLRSGYCAACWMAYVRDGQPDNRIGFEERRRNFLDGNNETAGQTA